MAHHNKLKDARNGYAVEVDRVKSWYRAAVLDQLMGFKIYILRRLLLAVVAFVGVLIVLFAIVQSMPVGIRMGFDPVPFKPWQVIARENHLYDPIYVKFYYWVTGVIFDHNLGIDVSGMPVFQAIMSRLPTTAELVMFAYPLALFLGITLGVKSASNKDKPLDKASKGLSIVGRSLPSFFLGIVLLFIFYACLGWFPPNRYGADVVQFINAHDSSWRWYTGLMTVDSLINGQFWIFVDAVRHLILPVTVLSLLNAVVVFRVTRSSMIETLRKDYISVAKAKGLSWKEVINSHARPNVLIPVITISGLVTGSLMTGIVITETVFNMGGVGQYFADSARWLDLPPVIGYALLSTVVFIVVNLIVDILCAYLDPRIRRS